MARPVVTTPAAARSIRGTIGTDFEAALEPEEFAKKVMALAGTPLGQALGRAARQRVVPSTSGSATWRTTTRCSLRPYRPARGRRADGHASGSAGALGCADRAPSPDLRPDDAVRCGLRCGCRRRRGAAAFLADHGFHDRDLEAFRHVPALFPRCTDRAVADLGRAGAASRHSRTTFLAGTAGARRRRRSVAVRPACVGADHQSLCAYRNGGCRHCGRLRPWLAARPVVPAAFPGLRGAIRRGAGAAADGLDGRLHGCSGEAQRRPGLPRRDSLRDSVRTMVCHRSLQRHQVPDCLTDGRVALRLADVPVTWSAPGLHWRIDRRAAARQLVTRLRDRDDRPSQQQSPDDQRRSHRVRLDAFRRDHAADVLAGRALARRPGCQARSCPGRRVLEQEHRRRRGRVSVCFWSRGRRCRLR